MFIVCRCRRPATTAVSFFHFFSIGDFHSDWPTSRSPQFGSSSSPGSDASFSAACVNHSDARAWLFSGRACTPVFFINGQSVIITPPDYYCFYKMMGSLKRQNGIWDVVFFSPVIISSLVGRWRIYIHDATSRLPSCQKASARVEIHLKSTHVCHLDAAHRKQRPPCNTCSPWRAMSQCGCKKKNY